MGLKVSRQRIFNTLTTKTDGLKDRFKEQGVSVVSTGPSHCTAFLHRRLDIESECRAGFTQKRLCKDGEEREDGKITLSDVYCMPGAGKLKKSVFPLSGALKQTSHDI